jgi:carbamoyl-phosphate synthase large subunit
VKVLVTGCFAPGTPGTLYGLNLAFGNDIEIYGVDTTPFYKKDMNFKEISEIPEPSNPTYIEKLSELVLKWGIEVVLVQTTNESLELSKVFNMKIGNAIVVGVGDFETVTKANDKFISQKIALTIPGMKGECYSYDELVPGRSLIETNENQGNNTFFKARNSSGGRGIVCAQPNWTRESEILKKPSSFYYISYSELKNYWDSRSEHFFDFFIDTGVHGTEYSVDVFIGKSGKIAIPRRRDKIRTGISQINTIIKNDELIKISLMLAEKLNLVGLFGFQFIVTEFGIYYLECNPRIQGTNLASILAGTNLIEYAVKEALNIDYDIVEPNWNSIFRRTSFGEVFFNDPK